MTGLGYPVPVVHEASGSEMVLERLDGPTTEIDGIAQGAALLRGPGPVAGPGPDAFA